MRYLNLTAKNLFSFKEVSFDFNNRGLLLITGTTEDNEHNGTGKTTLSNKILSYVLWGETPCGAKTDSVVHKGTEEAEGTVTFEGVDGEVYTVKRGRKPNYLRFFKGEENLSSRLETETQALINKKLGKSFEIFCFTDFFGRGKASEFLFLTSKSQLEIIEQILGIDKVDEYLLNIKKYETELSNLFKLNNNELNKLKGSLESYQLEKNRWEQYLNTLPSVDPNLKDIVSNLYVRLQQDQIHLKELQDSTDSINRELSNIRVKIASKFSLANKIINESFCPECNQSINKDKYDSLTDEVNKAKEELEELKNRKTNLTALLPDTKFNNARISFDKKFKEYNNLNSQLSQLNNINKAKETIEANSKSIEEIENKIKLLISKVDSIISDQGDLNFWKKMFSKEFRNYMIEQTCPYLNSRVQVHLEGLNHSEFKVNFSTVKTLKSSEDRVEFNIQVSRDEGGDGFGNLSAGEKQIVSFAIALALSELAESRVQCNSNLLILDEPFCNLDSRNSEFTVSYISTLSSKKETILLVSNDESLKQLIPSRVNITKENGISYVI